MENKDIIDKIKKLLELGDKEKNSSETEAESAMLKAQELMAKYEITLEMTEKSEISYNHEICDSKWNMGFRKPLAVVIANNFRCETYLKGRGGQVVFFGHAVDARIAREVFEFAYNFAMREGNRCYNKYYQMGKNTQGVFNSYTRGFIVGMERKLSEQSVALMVVKPADVKEKYEEMSKNFKRDSHGMRNNGFDPHAFNQGVQDGGTVLNGRQLAAN